MSTRTTQLSLLGTALTALAILSACGGGGGGTGSTLPPTTTPTTAPQQSTALSGTVTDDASPSPVPLAGAAVSLYPTGVALTGLAPLAQTTTAPNGTWSIGNGPVAGTYVLQIAPADSGHATLHKDVALSAGANAIGTTQLTVLSATEQSCITDFNQQRKTLGVSALAVDNAAVIAARAEAQAFAAWNGAGAPGGSGSIPSITPSVYASNGGLGTKVTGDDYDSGASDCAMAVGNMFQTNDQWYSWNAGVTSTWLGFGITPDPIGNSDYAAAVVQYP